MAKTDIAIVIPVREDTTALQALLERIRKWA